MTRCPTATVDVDVLRDQVREKYREVAEAPDATYHFHTGRRLAARLGYDPAVVDALPDRAVESFAGVANPFSLRTCSAGERVVDVGSGAGFDSFVAAAPGRARRPGRRRRHDRGDARQVRGTAAQLGLGHVEFREGLAEALPVEDGWADVVISNGVFNLCADKRAVFDEVSGAAPRRRAAVRRHRQRQPVPPEAMRHSTCGPVESPVACRVQGWHRCSTARLRRRR